MESRIELISTKILNHFPDMSSELLKMGKTLALSSGWHYALDWTWVTNNIGEANGKTILDAGAGIGLMQWYLSSKGANIISVDRSDRVCIPFHLLNKFNVTGYRAVDNPLNIKDVLNITNRRVRILKRITSLIRGTFGSALLAGRSYTDRGSIRFLNKDLRDLSEIHDNSVDIIISISALEHNEQISNIKEIIRELERVLVPGGMMLVTLPASAEKDWFFSPAYSWCLTESTLRDLFDLDKDTLSNFQNYEKIHKELKQSNILKKNISLRYYFQPQSGMPWGRWDPKYIPVGIIKIKQV